MNLFFSGVRWALTVAVAFALSATSPFVGAQVAPDEGVITPASPEALKPVYLILPNLPGSCFVRTYAPEFNRVERSSDGLKVRVRTKGWIDIGVCPPRYWVSLGRPAEGTYKVELFIDDDDTAYAEYNFVATNPDVGMPDRPAHDYSGLYWNPLESGTGLQIYQTDRDSLGVTLLTYDDQGQQQWIVIGVGHWTGPGHYVGQAWKTADGHPISSATPDEQTRAVAEIVGEAELYFGGGLGTDPRTVSFQIVGQDGLLYERSNYQRLEF